MGLVDKVVPPVWLLSEAKKFAAKLLQGRGFQPLSVKPKETGRLSSDDGDGLCPTSPELYF